MIENKVKKILTLVFEFYDEFFNHLITINELFTRNFIFDYPVFLLLEMVSHLPIESHHVRLGDVNASSHGRLGLSRRVSRRLDCINLTYLPRKEGQPLCRECERCDQTDELDKSRGQCDQTSSINTTRRTSKEVSRSIEIDRSVKAKAEIR